MNIEKIAKIIRSVLRQREKDFQEEFGQHYNIAAALLYGSRVKKTERPDSDLDFQLIGREDRTTDVDDFKYSFKNKLYREGGRDLRLDCYDVRLLSTTDFRQTLFSQDGVMKGNYLIVTPFKDIRNYIEKQAGIK